MPEETRGALLLEDRGRSPLAESLRGEGGASLEEVFSFMSSLYFRGKAAYARRFGSAPPGAAEGALVITPGLGLRPLHHAVTLSDMRAIAQVRVSERNSSFTDPLVRDASALLKVTGGAADFVLLGSIASAKYVEPLLGVLGYRLFYPAAFEGLGDMSRGSLLLAAARDGRELEYERVASK